jgi:propionyl-CoA carboxylase alpha chain
VTASATITRLLVANRGEIARRIMRTAREMGIASIAVYADGDADAPFVREADQAIALAGKSSAETYLDIAKILRAARRARADAVHPGYGFLSESADFARAVCDAGLIWVGPSPESIAAMGDKLESKRRMQEAGVPTLPSMTLGKGVNPRVLAARVGYPLLIKAAAGGGGRGMRVVESETGLASALESARREAASAFGDETVFLERWIGATRHVEIQVLGDRYGNLVHCFERECSIQRRHQKLIEEAPSPVLTPELRERMGAAALSAAKAVGYTSAGTVEFLLESSDRGDAFWFLEMNTRLQVEHPVTESICGLDLVREQLRIAQGEPLGFGQSDLSISGHAIEARLYAEDPARDFLPVAGRVRAWEPARGAGARFDSGIETGSVVGAEFDPLLAKVIVHAATRREAAQRLARVLETTRFQGIPTNRDFLVATLRHPAFLAGDTTTDFISRCAPARRRSPASEELRIAALAAALAAQVETQASARVLATLPSGWRNTPMPFELRSFRLGNGETCNVRYRARRGGDFAVEVDGEAYSARVRSAHGDRIDLEVDGERRSFAIAVDGAHRWVHGPEGDLELVEMPRFPEPEGEGAAGDLRAPLPGKVLVVSARVGERVEAGQILLIIEAMKMEHRVTAPHAGTLTWLAVDAGDQVVGGALLARIAADVKDEVAP